MPVESTTPDLVERGQWLFDAFVVLGQRGCLPDTTGGIPDRLAVVSTWADRAIQRTTSYTEVDGAHAVAERLAQERG
jgi:hypothetical protein